MNNSGPQSLFELFADLENRGIPKSEHYKYIPSFLESKSRRNHYPVHAVFELTPLCNFNCKMCYIHLSQDQFNKNNLLPVGVWKKIADDAKKAGLRTLVITGGECLTYPDFEELYTYLASLRLSIAIMTNGYLIDDRKLALFREYKPKIIQISIYGSTEEAYEAVTGVRAFDKVYQNILSLRDDGQNVKLSITPSAYMKDVKELITLAESLKLKYGVNAHLFQPRENTGRDKYDLSPNEYLEIYRFISTIHGEELKPVDWTEIPDSNHEGSQHFGLRCGSGRSTFGIRYDGLMCPCLSLSHITAEPLVVGFDQAWRQINREIERYPLPLECGDCIYKRRCLGCVAIHKDAALKGHCDPEVCERMKKLVHEGFIPLNHLC